MLIASLVITSAANAAWPERPVTVIVPFAAGGIADVVARLTAEWLQNALKQPFIVENQPGGAGIIAAEHVAKARGDGYTLMATPIFQITMAPFTHEVSFDPVQGHEQGGERRGLVVSYEPLHAAGMIAVCPMTAARTDPARPAEVRIPVGEAGQTSDAELDDVLDVEGE